MSRTFLPGSNDYDSSTFPTFDRGEWKKGKEMPHFDEVLKSGSIMIHTVILNVEGVFLNEKPPSFRCKFKVTKVFWNGLVKAPGVESKGDGINRPGIVITNALDDLTELYENAHLSDDGEVACIETEYRGSFKVASLNMVANFPFDRYDCCASFLLMGTNVYSEAIQDRREVQFVFEGAGGGVKGARNPPRIPARIFDVSSVADEWAVFDPELTAFNEWDTPQVQFSFQLRRKFEAHGWNGFLLIFVVGIMNFTAFGLDAGNTSERLALGVTTALTLISLKFALNSAPHSSQPNWQDVFLNLTVLFTLACMASFSALAPILDANKALDGVLMWVLVAFWVSICAYFCIPARAAFSSFHDGVLVPPTIGSR